MLLAYLPTVLSQAVSWCFYAGVYVSSPRHFVTVSSCVKCNVCGYQFNYLLVVQSYDHRRDSLHHVIFSVFYFRGLKSVMGYWLQWFQICQKMKLMMLWIKWFVLRLLYCRHCSDLPCVVQGQASIIKDLTSVHFTSPSRR